MFSFIRKFFERRRAIAAEREQLCQEQLQRVSKVLLDYLDAKNNSETLQKWVDDNRFLVAELRDVAYYKKAPSYRRLNDLIKRLEVSWAQAGDTIRAIKNREQQKRADAEYISNKINQWATKQKKQKIKATSQKELKRRAEQLSSHSQEAITENDFCPCCGKDGTKKRLYSTESEALAVAEHRSKIVGYPLRVYPCPYAEGYHITSNQG